MTRDEWRVYMREYYHSPRGRECVTAAQKKYLNTPKGKASRRRVEQKRREYLRERARGEREANPTLRLVGERVRLSQLPVEAQEVALLIRHARKVIGNAQPVEAT